ncbi:cadherin-related family member 5 [Phyllostomus discolor]|uniref:Cadherin-related family member 5 n=1 Tax=Phyllostomus discolor TaxID=89673 RepID=A0A7E6E407_9CHIR|nr:cadherin-related family member 5 [Phyllostomus discolor]
MGAWALLLGAGALLLLLPGGAEAQACSVSTNVVEVEENKNYTQPLVDIFLPEGQQVTLAPSSTPFAFRIEGTQLFLNVTPDYEENSVLEAHLECRRGGTVVTQQKVLVIVLDVNDNPPRFPFEVKVQKVPEDTKVNTTVIPETELQAEDLDKDDILFYTLQEVTPGARDLFSLVGVNLPALRLDRPLDFDQHQNMTFRLLVRDTQEEDVVPSHTATATLVLEVQPADLQPPWFLPCVYEEPHFCLPAQYRGAIPTGHRLPSPLILWPGPIYAVDGDRGINQRIIYSLVRRQGNEDDTFAIGAESGNLTMTKNVSSPQTFLLLVKGEQEDRARYSMTQVTVEARDASGSLPRFPQSLYRGTVAVGSGVGTAVKDAAAPSQPLRIWAQDPEFPDLNSAITYRVTNNSNFRMHGEEVLTAAQLLQAGVFYAEVEATNTVTSGRAATVLEIQVTEQPPTPTGPPGSPTPPGTGRTTRPTGSSTSEAPSPTGPSQGPSTTVAGGTAGPRPPTPSQGPSTTVAGGSPGPRPPTNSSTSESPRPPGPSQGPSTTVAGGSPGPRPPTNSSTSESPRPPGPSQGPSTTVSGGSPGSHPPTGTTLRPPTWSTPGGPSGEGTSTSPSSASPIGNSTQTPNPGSPGTGGGTGGVPPGGSHADDRRFSVTEMAALGGVLGALLLLAIIALVVLVHKHYGPQLRCCSSKAPELQGFDNKTFLADDGEANWAPAPSTPPTHTQAEVPAEVSAEPLTPEPPAPPLPTLPAPASPSPIPESPAVARDEGGPAGVRSILTKERRPEGGYKAVWFGENIGAEADVVVLNAPTSDADRASHSGSEGSGDEGDGASYLGDPPYTSTHDSTYI